ncbi:cupin domain-containing protein [Brackiella oedipodis]|uniref:cupin domain-containing protein n=1 Tax=Brackiella oedipodis TaxID=124225 RepID=UPI000491EFF4|nr:cupin domain-containing protein [Brackiella oedipodis]
MNLDKKLDLLGQYSPWQFMQEVWQQKPLLIRQAIANFTLPISIDELQALAQSEQVESRLIRHQEQQWFLQKGPIHSCPSMNESNWTLLVQSVDLHHAAVQQLARLFSFIPEARFDDVMISLAADGGGVGPHFDSYDVFLLQAHGKRHWRISQQADKTLIPGLPCRILQNFQPEQAFTLEPGDMLYLPPQCAHDGVALGPDCITISIGFRTLSLAQMVRGILEAAADQVSINNGLGIGLYSEPALKGMQFAGVYEDRHSAATNHSAELPQRMIDTGLGLVNALQFSEDLVARYLGCWLTEPNQLSEFQIAAEQIELEDLSDDTLLCLDLQSRMLYKNQALFFNGEVVDIALNPILIELADNREIAVAKLRDADADTQNLILQALDDGWMQIKTQ